MRRTTHEAARSSTTGFVMIPPTDYYIRPFLLASEEKRPGKKRYYLSVCLGPTPTSEHIFRYTLDFATVFNTTPSFMMSWINNFSHNTNAIPEKTDKTVVTFFHQLEETGAFNPYPTAFPYGNGMVLHFYQQQESSTTKTVHKVINKGLKAYV